MLKISIVKGFDQPVSRNTQNGTRWHQIAYAHFGGAYPAEIRIPLADPNGAYLVGAYVLDNSSFRVGKYGDLEINPFQLKLVQPARAAVAQAPQQAKAS